MTTAPTPQARTGSLGRYWRAFRQWRQGRPFWGGLLVILSGVVIFYSGRLDLGMDIHFGQEGFLATIIPAALVLAGMLLWISPAQRLFYGILAALIAVYSLIGVNLGGWFVGMLLGIVGGSLGASWSPDTTVASEQPDAASVEDAPDDGIDGIFAGDQRNGMLTDELPTRTVSPLHENSVDDSNGHTPRHAADEPASGAGAADEQLPPVPPLPRRDVRGVGHVIAAVLLAGTLAAVVHHPSPASAAPTCPPPAAGQPGGQPAPNPPAAPAPGTPTPTVAPAPSTTGSSTAVPEPERQGPVERIVGGVVDFFRGLFGGGSGSNQPAADPSASATPSPSGSPPASPPAPQPGQPTATKPAPAKTSSAACPTAAPPKPKVIAAAPGQPPVAQLGATMLADNLRMSGLSFDGVVNLPTSTGTVRVLQFSMRQSVATPFELRVAGGPRVLSLKSSQLTVEGNVKFYTAKFSGNLLCLIPVTFTPDSPPPLILPELLFCNANITLNFVQTDVLRAPNLNIAFAA